MGVAASLRAGNILFVHSFWHKFGSTFRTVSQVHFRLHGRFMAKLFDHCRPSSHLTLWMPRAGSCVVDVVPTCTYVCVLSYMYLTCSYWYTPVDESQIRASRPVCQRHELSLMQIPNRRRSHNEISAGYLSINYISHAMAPKKTASAIAACETPLAPSLEPAESRVGAGVVAVTSPANSCVAL